MCFDCSSLLRCRIAWRVLLLWPFGKHLSLFTFTTPYQSSKPHLRSIHSSTCMIFSTDPAFPSIQSRISGQQSHKKKRHLLFHLSTPPRLLPSERASLCQSSFSSGRLAQYGAAAAADDNSLGVREDGGDGEAAGAFDVHKEGAGGGYKGLYDLVNN